MNVLSRFRNRSILFIFDWDGTITIKDTMGLIGKIVEKKPASETTWADVVRHYVNTHHNHVAKYEPKAAERRTIAEEREWLSSLRPVEESSAHKAETSHLFKGVTATDVQLIAKNAVKEGEVAIRKGWNELLTEIDARQKSQLPQNLDMVAIVSANWSQLFIMECLKASGCSMDLLAENGPWKPKEGHSYTIRIYGNEIQGLHSREGSSGLLCHPNGRDFRTSEDKSKWIAEFAKTTIGDGEQRPVIYFGDSMGDFDALLAADLGVCIRNETPSGSQQQLLETFERLGVPVPHILDANLSGFESIVWALDFQEVVEALATS